MPEICNSGQPGLGRKDKRKDIPITRRYATTFVTVGAAAALLAACGGGDSGPSGVENTPPGTPENGTGTQPSPDQGFDSLSSAAAAVPVLEGRTVVQSSNRDRENVTTDSVSGVFDRGPV